MSNPSRSELISHWFPQTLDETAIITGRMGWCEDLHARQAGVQLYTWLAEESPE